MFAQFEECGAITSFITVEECVQGCANTFTYTETFSNCGVEHLFAGTADQTVVEWYWDFGDGSTSTLQSPNHVFQGGTYQVSLTTVDINGCQATSTSSLSTNGGFVVDLFQDSVACNGIYLPNYTTSGGSGNYTYNWAPEALMDDPTAANPVMTVAYDTWVEVILTDTQFGCTSVDSMYIYANLPINETLTLCDDSLYLEVNPGSQVYQWSFIDQFGNTTQMQEFGNEIIADAVGQYTCFTYYSGCNTVTHTFVVEECTQAADDVWPGDANSDNIVTNADALYLGLAFNQTGPTRSAATLNWVGQPATDWAFNFSANNVNLKHADCDGNGIVNFDDTLAIDFNYLNTHNKFESAPPGGNPLLWIEATPDTVGLEHAIDIVVHLGTAAQPVDSLHGVAFSLTFDESLVMSQGLSIDFGNCVLGTEGIDVLTFQETMFIDGVIDIAVTRNTLENFQGYGPIAHARIVTTDNLSGYTRDFPIGLSSVTALTATEAEVLLSVMPDTVVIDPNKVGIVEPEQLDVQIYPNPTKGLVTLAGLTSSTRMAVYNSVGQMVAEYKLNEAKQTLDLSALSNGMYILKLETDKAVAVERLRLIQ
jgi:PKD repeat protein